MSGLAEVIAYREEVIKGVLDLLSAERALSDENASAQAVMDAEKRLTVAARNLTRSVDEMPMAEVYARGWAS